MHGEWRSNEDYEHHKRQPYFLEGAPWKVLISQSPFSKVYSKSMYHTDRPLPASTPSTGAKCMFMELSVKFDSCAAFLQVMDTWAKQVGASCEGFVYGETQSAVSREAKHRQFYVFQRHADTAPAPPAEWEDFVATEPFMCAPAIITFNGLSS